MSAVAVGEGSARMYQIGEVVGRVGLSATTIRLYEELGLLPQSSRSAGRFRLYTDADIDRLGYIKQFRPLGFSLDEVRTLMASLDALHGSSGCGEPSALDTVEHFCGLLEDRCAQRRLELAAGEATLELLSQMISGAGDVPSEAALGACSPSSARSRRPGRVEPRPGDSIKAAGSGVPASGGSTT